MRGCENNGDVQNRYRVFLAFPTTAKNFTRSPRGLKPPRAFLQRRCNEKLKEKKTPTVNAQPCTLSLHSNTAMQARRSTTWTSVSYCTSTPPPYALNKTQTTKIHKKQNKSHFVTIIQNPPFLPSLRQWPTFLSPPLWPARSSDHTPKPLRDTPSICPTFLTPPPPPLNK